MAHPACRKSYYAIHSGGGNCGYCINRRVAPIEIAVPAPPSLSENYFAEVRMANNTDLYHPPRNASLQPIQAHHRPRVINAIKVKKASRAQNIEENEREYRDWEANLPPDYFD